MSTSWVDVNDRDELEQFYLSVLPKIKAAAKACGYAIGVHGSLRRDLDLIATPWVDKYSDKDTLANAIQKAACGFESSEHFWEGKPLGRMATAFPICWTWHETPPILSNGHIDPSVTPVIEVLPPPAEIETVIEENGIADLKAEYDELYKSGTNELRIAYLSGKIDGLSLRSPVKVDGDLENLIKDESYKYAEAAHNAGTVRTFSTFQDGARFAIPLAKAEAYKEVVEWLKSQGINYWAGRIESHFIKENNNDHND